MDWITEHLSWLKHWRFATERLWFVLGAFLGSFLNVCIYRMPRELSVVTPRSFCPKCRAAVRWHDNIPILSWLWLGGKCRHCGQAISWQYPIVEAVSGGALFYMYWWYFMRGQSPDWGIFLAHALLVFGLIVCTFIDFEWRIIPDEISKTGMWAGVILSFLYPALQSPLGWGQEMFGLSGSRIPLDSRWEALLSSGVGMAVGAGMIWLVGVAGSWAFKQEAMGFGDVKLMGMAGAFLGWQTVFLAFWVASLLGFAYVVVHWLITRDKYMPYGPFLALATVMVMMHRPQIVNLIFYQYPNWLSRATGHG